MSKKNEFLNRGNHDQVMVFKIYKFLNFSILIKFKSKVYQNSPLNIYKGLQLLKNSNKPFFRKKI